MRIQQQREDFAGVVKNASGELTRMEAAPPAAQSMTAAPQQMMQMTGRPAAMMPFMDAMKTCYQLKYVSFEGRASRSEYWWLQLGYFLVVLVAGIIDGVLGMSILGTIVVLGSLLPLIGAGVRRLHDTGRSGWMLLLALIPFVGVILLIVWMVSDGQPMDNQYGAVPTNTL